MHPTLALLERQRSQLDTQCTHWFDLPEPSVLEKRGDRRFNLLASSNNDASLASQDWPTAELNILFFPKAKDRLDWWLTKLSQQLQSGQTLWVVGENNGGIKSLAKRVKDQFACHKIDSARHCSLFELSPLAPIKDSEKWQHFSIEGLTCSALPGVFSAGRLDKGTQVLLGVLPQLKGKVLEFGGGCGVLTALLAQQKQVEQVTAVEIDLLAVRSSMRTLQDNQLAEKASTLWSDGTAQLEPQPFNAIVTNPPFHQGIRTEYGPTQDFFASAHHWLKPRGELIWVANDFLNYQDILLAHFHPPELLAHERGFKVFRAIRK